jgi:hypothetical protein
MVFKWHFSTSNVELTVQEILERYLYIQSFSIKCNLRRLQDMFNDECTYLDDSLNIIQRLTNNNNKIIYDKLQTQIRNNEKNNLMLKDINYWFKHSIGIILNQNKNADLTLIHNEFSSIMIKIIKTVFVSQSLKKELIEEIYKPSRIQYIVDNYGIDALDDY